MNQFAGTRSPGDHTHILQLHIAPLSRRGGGGATAETCCSFVQMYWGTVCCSPSAGLMVRRAVGAVDVVLHVPSRLLQREAPMTCHGRACSLCLLLSTSALCLTGLVAHTHVYPVAGGLRSASLAISCNFSHFVAIFSNFSCNFLDLPISRARAVAPQRFRRVAYGVAIFPQFPASFLQVFSKFSQMDPTLPDPPPPRINAWKVMAPVP